MNMKNHYKEKFLDYDNDQLKDIIAARFREPLDDEVTAAIELLKDRSDQSISPDSNLSLRLIPNASMSALLEIIKNPNVWGKGAVEVAEAEIFSRERHPIEENSAEKGNKTTLQIVLGIIGIIISVRLIKLVAIIIFLGFLFYGVLSCLGGL
jgi:hypothetical protein